MPKSLAAVVLLAGVVLSGCSAYPSFEGRVLNERGTPEEVKVEVLGGTRVVFEDDKTLAAGERWDLGTFTDDEGEYTIRVYVAGRGAAEDRRFFGHDEGPGGFVVRLVEDAVTIDYWNV